MPFNDSVKNQMLDTLRTNAAPSLQAAFASLHTGNPSTTGANEVAGGSPPYARKSITWNAAATGSMSASNQPVFDVPAATTVAYVGFFTAVSGGTFLGSADVTDETFGAQGTYTLTSTTFSLT